MKRIVSRLTGALLLMAVWLLLSALGWGFVFTRLTDARPEQKIVLFAEAEIPKATELAVELEGEGYPGIRMVKAMPFSYAMMGESELLTADLYIVPASHAKRYADWFAPLPEEMTGEEGTLLSLNGVPFGVRVYDAEAGVGAADSYIAYRQDVDPVEDYYLFFGARSTHVPGLESAADDAAVAYALRLLDLN